MSKPKINKTIITRGGGNIFIPEKIIAKEYPEGGGDTPTPTPTPTPKEPDVYVVKITNIQNFDTANKWGVYRGTTFSISNALNILYTNALEESEKPVIAIATIATGPYVINISGFTSNSTTPFDSKLLSLEFWCKNKEGALRTIASFKESAEIEANFEYTQEDLEPYLPII